jgi:5-methylcytosine-specific restriction protein A
MPKSRQPKEIWRTTRRRVWEWDKGVCQSPLQPPLCKGKSGELTLRTCHIDHIRSGKLATNNLDNLRVLCRTCHVLRRDMRHRGMISKALKDGIIPPDWRELTW